MHPLGSKVSGALGDDLVSRETQRLVQPEGSGVAADIPERPAQRAMADVRGAQNDPQSYPQMLRQVIHRSIHRPVWEWTTMTQGYASPVHDSEAGRSAVPIVRHWPQMGDLSPARGGPSAVSPPILQAPGCARREGAQRGKKRPSGSWVLARRVCRSHAAQRGRKRRAIKVPGRACRLGRSGFCRQPEVMFHVAP